MRRNWFPLILAVAVLMVSLAGRLPSQGSPIVVKGVVRGPSGTVVSGAVVRLIGERSEELASAVTKPDGSFELALDSAAHDFTLKVSLSGFETLVRSHLEPKDLTRPINLQLKDSSKAAGAPMLGGIFADDTQLKASGIDDPSSGGGYSDSTSATRSSLLRDYAKGQQIQEDIGSIDIESASEAQIDRYGSGLLLRQQWEPAAKIFQRGVQRYPKSKQLQLGLGTSLYGQGSYQDAVRAWLAAYDLDPNDPQPCLFLAKASMSAASIAPELRLEILRRIETFALAQAGNPLAHYYYGIALLKAPGEAQKPDLAAIEFGKALSLDPNLADAHFELANLAAEQHRAAEAIQEYLQTIRLRPDFAAAHYRLAQAYERAGEKSKAQAEFVASEKLRGKKPEVRQEQ